jgi:flagellar assembly protein FliH
LPDVYRNPKFLENQDAVLIPDVQFDSQNEEEKVTSETQDADQVMTEEDDAAEPEKLDPLCYTESDFQEAVAEARKQIAQELQQKAYRDVAASEEQKIRDCLAKVDRVLSQMDNEHEAFMNSYRENLADLSLSIAEKVVLHHIDTDDDCLKDLIMQNINAAKKKEWISVKISDELSGLIKILSKELKRPEYENVSLDAGPYPHGTCLVESPDGIIDASVKEQIKNIRTDFQKVQ